MRTLRRKTQNCIVVAIGLMLVLTLVPSPAARAEQPQFFTFPINYTAPIQGQCAFDVLEHGEGTLRWMYHPNNGNPIASVYHYDLRGTYTNAVTGTSVFWAEDVVLKGYYQDGSLIVFLVGLDVRVNIPGQGIVLADVGRLVGRFDPGSPNPEIIFEAGQWENFSVLCSTLE